MKKKLIGVLFSLVIVISLLPGCGKESLKEAILAASEAEISGQGINQDGETVDTAYVSDLGLITNFGTDATITYTVPEGVEGKYDIYIEYGKSPYAVGTTQASLIVNGEEEYLIPAALESCSQDFSDLFSMGRFAMAKDVELKEGDTLTVKGKAGFEMEFGGNKVSSMTAVGDMYLYSAGTEVAVGYDDGVVTGIEDVDSSDTLSGLNIAWLGSSVTFGAQSNGYSMADAIADNHPSTNSYKFAISGTTLVNDGPDSYVERLKDIGKGMKIDLLVVQLSTNDATQGKVLGALSSSKNITDFDDTTVIGAIEYIIAYAQENLDCKVVFYTGTYFESPEYSAMVESLLAVQDKWDIGVVDLWNNSEMKSLFGTEQIKSYMKDDIHPNRDGYVEWWTPAFESYLSDYLK